MYTFYRKDNSLSIKLELFPIVDEKLKEEFCDLILMKQEEGGSESRALRLPVLGEPHVLIIPYRERYISSAIIPLYKLRFRNYKGYPMLITGYDGALLKLVMELPMFKEVVDCVGLTTKYII